MTRFPVRCSMPALALAAALGFLPTMRPQPAAALEAVAAIQDLAFENLVLNLPDARVTAPSAKLTGTRLSKEAFLAIFDPGAKEPWATRLARLDAGSLTAPELRIERSGGGTKQTTLYRDFAATGIRAGKVAEASASGAELSVEIDGAVHKGRYGRLRSEEIDLPTIARLYAEPGDDAGAPARIYGLFSVSDIAFEQDGTTLRIASFVARDVAGRRTPSTWSGVTDLADLLNPDTASSAERGRKLGLLADFLDASSVGAIEVTGLSGGIGGDAPGSVEIARLAYASGGPDPGTALSGLSVKAPGARLALDRITLSAGSLAPTIAGLRQLAKAPDAAPLLRELIPTVGSVNLSGLRMEVDEEPAENAEDDERAGNAGPDAKGRAPQAAKPADPLAGSGKTGSPALSIALREGSLASGASENGAPAETRIRLNGLTVPAAALQGMPALGALASFGYRDLDLDLTADTAWNESAKEFELHEAVLSGKDMGTIRLHGTLGGIGSDVLDPDALASGVATANATVKSLELTLRDAGLYDRFIDAQAKALSLKPDELRQEYVTASQIGVPVILGNSTTAKTIGAAMGKFAKKPGTLTINAKAKDAAGLSAADLSNAGTPAAVLNKLDVTATAD